MNRKVINLIAAAERSERGYADVPPGSINDEIESVLAIYGYAIALSDRLWIGGYRVHSPESADLSAHLEDGFEVEVAGIGDIRRLGRHAGED